MLMTARSVGMSNSFPSWETVTDSTRSVPLMDALLQALDGGLVGPEVRPPVDDGGVGDGVGDEGHVDGAVASSEHGDLLPDNLLLGRKDVRDTLPEELVLSGASHLLGLEAAHPDGDDDGLRVVCALVRGDYELPVPVLDRVDPLVLLDVALYRLGLGVELVRELPRLDGLETGVVVDSLLGVQAHELPSDACGIEDQGLHHLGPGVDSGGESRAACSNYYHVIAHWSHEIMSRYKNLEALNSIADPFPAISPSFPQNFYEIRRTADAISTPWDGGRM